MVKIKAIDTKYNGYLFRSRLEARWAVFFDSLGVRYEYEMEGYDLDGVWYLPDFWLPEHDCFVEIKPLDKQVRDNKKCYLLNKESGKKVLLVSGSPHAGKYRVWLYASPMVSGDVVAELAGLMQKLGDDCRYLNFLTGSILDFSKGCSEELIEKLYAAYDAASMARF